MSKAGKKVIRGLKEAVARAPQDAEVLRAQTYAAEMSLRRKTAFKALCDDLNSGKLPRQRDVSLCGPRLVHDIEDIPIVLTPFGTLVATILGHACPKQGVGT